MITEVRIYRLLLRFDARSFPANPPDSWVTERAYTAEDAITQVMVKQRVAWPEMTVLQVEPYETVI